MSYATQSLMAKDADLHDRIAACAATQPGITIQPLAWADQNQWHLSGTAGWGDAYAAAITAANPRPGWDDTVITDAMILAAVQGLLGVA